MENNASSRPINCQLYLLTKIDSSFQNLLQFLIINLFKCLFICFLIHLCHFCYGLMFFLLIHCKLENLFSVNFLVRKLKSITQPFFFIVSFAHFNTLELKYNPVNSDQKVIKRLFTATSWLRARFIKQVLRRFLASFLLHISLIQRGRFKLL